MSKFNNKYLQMAQNRVYSEQRDKSEHIKALLDDKIYGICFSPYTEGQEPGDEITEEQIEARLSILKPHVTWIRSFSCSDGNELIPAVAKRMGFKTLVGAWLDDNEEKNQQEIDAAISMAKAGVIDLLAVGNEVLLREELTDDQLVEYILYAKKEAGVPVGYVDAYYLFENFPKVADACDVIMANCYPFWEGIGIEHAHVYMRDMYYRAVNAAKGKPVLISETGWPNQGTAFGAAVPNDENAKRYFLQTATWTESLSIPLFYFSSFDEDWKVSDEGDVGAYWGLWDKSGKPKFW